jgi:hypothetical protein
MNFEGLTSLYRIGNLLRLPESTTLALPLSTILGLLWMATGILFLPFRGVEPLVLVVGPLESGRAY